MLNLATLRETELFSSLLDEDLAYVVTETSQKRLGKGELLFASGQLAEHFYIVQKGSIRIYRARSDGGEDEMAIFTAGDTLGDFDFARSASYDASAEATEDTLVTVFPAVSRSLLDLERERPDVAARLRLSSLAMIASRLRSTQRLISENVPWVQELKRRAYEDGGTGLWTKAFLDEVIFRSIREGTAFIVLKPDRFKLLVDAKGHAAGDEAMVKIAVFLQSLVRSLSRGWAVRLKSNELALIVPDCPPGDAATLCERVVKGFRSLECVSADEGFPGFTFSATAVWSVWPLDGEPAHELLARTWEAMLALWKSGGNRASRLDPAFCIGTAQ